MGVPFAGGGIGTIASHAAEGLHRGGLLGRVLAPVAAPSTIPAHLVRTFPLSRLAGRLHGRITSYVVKDNLFDLWASRHVAPSDVFYGWAHHSLFSMRAARCHGAITMIDRGSAEPATQKRLLDEEYRRLGLRGSPMSRWNVGKMVRESAEADLIAVPSKFVYQTFVDAGYPDSKLFLNPLGVDLDRFSPGPGPPPTFRVVFVGIVGIQKGVHYLLRAWNALRLKDAELCVIGWVDPSFRGTLKAELARMAGSRVVWPGPVAAPEHEYRRSSVFVLPSLQDGFGSVVIEAMASGLPVIVTDRTGARDCVREGVDGFVVPAGDADALGERLRYLHEHPAAISRMGAEARQRAQAYTWDAYRQRLVTRVRALAG